MRYLWLLSRLVYKRGAALWLTAVALLPSQVRAEPVALPVAGGFLHGGGFYALVTVGDISGGVSTGGGFIGNSGFVTLLDFLGPLGTLNAVSGTANTDATITAELTDDVAVTSASLFFRTGGSVNFTELAMTQTSATTWSATIPANAVNFRGVQYFVVATDGLHSSTFPPGAPGAVTANLPISVADHPAFSLIASQYALLGVPIQPATAVPTDVFDELGGYDPAVWRYGTFDPATSAYKEHPNAAPASTGQGFWVISKNAKDVAISGVTANLSGQFSIPLKTGFNQVANPFGFAVDVQNVVFPPDVDRNLIGWSGTGYLPNQTQLQPGNGYFIFNGATATRTLQILPLGPGATSAATSARERSNVAAASDPDWSVRVRAEAGALFDDGNRFGMRLGATSDKDAYDFMDAPPPPSGHVTLSLEDDAGRALLTDWRATDPDGATWKVRLSSDQAGQMFRVSFTPERALPDGWRLVLFEAGGAVETDLLTHPELTGTLGTGAQTWTIVAGSPNRIGSEREALAAQVHDLRFGSVFPNPVRAGRLTSIDLAVPTRTDASLRVFDVKGRLVRSLLDGPVERGVHRVTWRGDDRDGRAAPPGMYFIKVRAGSHSAQRRVLLLD